MNQKKWSGRTFSSFCSLVSFVLLFVTGIILFIQPHGRVAYWTGWDFLTLQKDQWGNLHIFSGLLFLVAGGFHLAYNWKPLVKYFSSKVQKTLRFGREMLLSALLLVWIIVSGIWSLPPLVYVVEWGEAIKESWVSSPELEPPFGHAELVSLKILCRKQGIALDQAMVELRQAGFTVPNEQSTLAQIADSKGGSGMDVYAVIKKLETPPKSKTEKSQWTPQGVKDHFAGSGVGRKTLGQIISEQGLAPETVHQRLSRAGIDVRDEDKIKDVASENELTPIKILTIILVEKGPAQDHSD